MAKAYAAVVLGVGLSFTNLAQARTRPSIRYTATAYSDAGQTASGALTHRRIVAADPAILPIGSRIQVSGAGRYSGVYTVADTGSKIQGRKVDIFIPNQGEAKRFGKRTVRVKVLRGVKPPTSYK